MVVCGVAGGAIAAGFPAWMLTRRSIVERLKGAGQRVVVQRTRAQLGLLVLQGALSMVLLVGAGLFVRSLTALQGLDLGVDAGAF